jgi:aspartyl-tRNA(Asn)/glutamyl-tRNA(Gln) amidotransferase subunit A
MTPPTAVDIAAGLRTGALSAVGVVDMALAASREAHASTNCFVRLDEEEARVQAARLDDTPNDSCHRRLPLAGVPYAFKDMFTRRGRPPGLGVQRTSLRSTDADTPCLDRLDAAGAIAVGRLNLDPYGYSATGLNSHHGHVRNPLDCKRITGGSSSGAAAAVASGAVPLAVGTDTAGSVRIPAALCGVVGFKPSFGRVSRRGSIPLSHSQDTVGIIARTVPDVALALSVMSAYDPDDPASIPTTPISPSASRCVDLLGIRVGIDPGHLRKGCHPEVVSIIRSGWEVLQDLGAQLVEVNLDELHDYDRAGSLLTWCEASAIHDLHFADPENDYPPSVRSRLHQAFVTSGADHVLAMCVQGMALARILDTVLSDCDVLATSTTLVTAPTIAEAINDPVTTTMQLLRTTRPFNFLGLPAITVPAGTDTRGLPVGLHLAGRPFADHTVLSTAAAFEARSASAAPHCVALPEGNP